MACAYAHDRPSQDDPDEDQTKRTCPKEPIRAGAADDAKRRGGVRVNRIVTGRGTGGLRRTQLAALEKGRWSGGVDLERSS